MDLTFWAKRVIGMAVQPLPLALFFAVLGAAAVLTRRRKAALQLFVVSWLVLLAASFPPLVRLAARALEAQYAPLTAAAGPQPYAIVVLGNGVAHPGDRAMPALTRLNHTARARLTEGVRLALLHPEAVLVTTGYGMGLENCADAMAGAAMELGVPESRIERMQTSVNTEHEAELVRALAEDREVIVVTSAVHMPRTMEYFRDAGVRVVPAPCDYAAPVSDTVLSAVSRHRWRPRGNTIADSEALWHEWMGLAHLYISRAGEAGE